MESILQRVEKVVAAYNPRQKGGRLKAARALLSSLLELKKHIRENAQTDRGCAQRIARDLDKLLSPLPDFRQLGADSQAMHSRHTKRLAEEHIDEIEDLLKGIVSQEEETKKAHVRDWVAGHPVFGELKKIAWQTLPKSAYILLFRQSGENDLELVTRAVGDSAVFTRFRRQDVSDETRLLKTFGAAAARPVVGAAVISERELLAVVGKIPQPEESGDLLKLLLSLSRDAAGRPARDFIERNPALKTLHEMSSRRKLPREAYVLLFEECAGASGDELQIVVRTGSEGKPVSRFWAQDFAVAHRVSDFFRGRRPVAGAAIIDSSGLLEVIGQVPQPAEGQSQLDVLLQASKTAVARPSLDFIAENPVLAALHELANGELQHKDAQVILFKLSDGGRSEVLSLSARQDKRQDARQDRRPAAMVPLSEFQSAKSVHDRFSRLPAIAGASVIEDAVAAGPKSRSAPREAPDKSNDARRREPPTPRKPVVIAAFGRTPLKINLLATEETFRRLGIML